MRWAFRIAALLAVLAAVVVAALVLLGGDDDADTTVERVPVDGPIELGAPPAAYRIEYTRELTTSDIVDTEIVLGRPALELRTERADTLELTTLGVLETGPPDQERTALVISPTVAVGAPVVSGDLDALIDEGLAVDLERAGTVADRPCRFVRFGGDIGVAPLVEPTDEDHTDVCIDEQSLVLHEETTVAGRVTRRRTATVVDTDPSLDDDAFTPRGERLPSNLGGGRVRRMTDDSRFPDVDFHELDDAPEGYEHLGRYVVAGDAEVDPQGMPGARTVTLADVYVDGTRLLVVENVRTTTAGVAGLPTDTGIPWTVEGHEGVRLLLGVGQSELRTDSVRVVGTGPVDELVEVFEALTRTNGPAESEPYDETEDVLDDPPS
jgi:hypothetical protein